MARSPLSLALSLGVVLAGTSPWATAQAFEDVTLRTGLTGVLLDFQPDGTGMCAGDFDGDGDIDLVVPGQTGRLIRLFRNNGDMWFADRTFGAGLGVARSARTVQAADIDNDGDLDVFVGNAHQPVQLLLNDGQARFTEVAAARGLNHVTSNRSASFGDYDADGLVDLYVGNGRHPSLSSVPEANILYRNTGDGHFEDVTAAAGVGHLGVTVSTMFLDFDGDGDLDILCVNEDGQGPSGTPNELFLNQGDGTFVAGGTSERANSSVDGRGVDAVDVFNDGDGVDYFVSDARPSNLFQVRNAGNFINATNVFGLTGASAAGAVHFADFDNDGWQDLHIVNSGVANQIFRNPAQPVTAEAPWTLVPNPQALTGGQVTAIVADFDNDGRVDILNRMLATPGNPYGLVMHKNITADAGEWLGVKPVGTISPKDGLGAQVRVLTGVAGEVQSQSVRSGVGYLSGNDHGLHFGLGDTETVDVEVTWPTGQVQRVEGVSAGQVLEVHEPRFVLTGEATLGGVCFLDLESGADNGRNHAVFLSAQPPGAGTPLPGGQTLPITLDWLSDAAIMPGNGLIWGAVAGIQRGRGQAFLNIPDLAWLEGVKIYAAALVFDVTEEPFFRTVFPNSVEIEFVR